jgi:hypothetical protein
LLTGALWHEMAWTEISFSMTFTLTGVFTGDSARERPLSKGTTKVELRVPERVKAPLLHPPPRPALGINHS